MKQNKPEIIKRGNRYFLKTVPTAFKYTFSNPDTGISKDLEFHHMTGIYEDGNHVIVDRNYFTSNFIKYGGETYSGYSVPNTDKWNIIGLDGTYSYIEFREIAITVRTHITDEDLTDTGNIIITGMDLTNHIYKKNLTQECKSMFYNYAKDLKSYVRSTLLSKGLTPNYNYYVISQPEEFDITFIFNDLYNESINISQKRINVIAKNNLILNQDSDVLEYIEEIPVEIIFYKNSAENNRVDKTPFLEETLRLSGGACKFRDNISKISPSFEIEYKGNLNANYCYIPIFNRYYYINDIIAVRNKLWSIDCSCDTLMSFKDKILDIECFVSRNEFNKTAEIPDEHFTCNIKRNISYSEIEQTGSFRYSLKGDVPYVERYDNGIIKLPYGNYYVYAYEPQLSEDKTRIIGIDTSKPITNIGTFYDYFLADYSYNTGTVSIPINGGTSTVSVELEVYYKIDLTINYNYYDIQKLYNRELYQQYDLPEFFQDLSTRDKTLSAMDYKVLSQNYVILVSGKSNIATYYNKENLKGGIAPLSNSLRALIVNQPTLIKILSQVYSSDFTTNNSLLFQTLNGTIQGIFAYPFTVLGDPPFIYSVESDNKTTIKLGLANIELDNDFYVSIYDIPQETKELNAFIDYDYDFSKIGNTINGYIQIIKSDYFTIDREFKNYLDYNPYSDYVLYLPYYGTYNMKVNDLLGKEIRIIYAVNILTKQTNIYITVKDDITDKDNLYDVIECEIGFDIPFSESNRNEQKRNLLFSTLSAGVHALTKGAVKGVQLSASEEPRKLTPKTKKETAKHKQWRKEQTAQKVGVAISGIGHIAGVGIDNLPSFATTGEAKVSGMLSLLDPSKFYLIKYTPDPLVKEDNMANYNRLFGQPYFAYDKLSNLHGFTVISAIHIEDLDTALTEEKEDIEERLLAGVILPYK